MSDSKKPSRFSKAGIFNCNSYVELKPVRQERDYIFSYFARNIGLLLESKKPRKEVSRKGRLDTRKLHKHGFSDSVFSKHLTIPKSDTTIVFLVDGSGSMSHTVRGGANPLTRLGLCAAVCSAFAKAVDKVLKNDIKFEVFLKSAPPFKTQGLGVEGNFVVLSRVLTNSKNVNDYDSILSLSPNSPVDNYCEDRGKYYEGSYTAEHAVLPALMKWMKKNIVTKNVIVFNLTDGESWARLGNEHFVLGNDDSKTLGLKYLRGIPNSTLIIGNESTEKKMRDVYGSDILFNPENVKQALIKKFLLLVNSLY